MTAILITLTVLALVGYGLERNHARHRGYPHPRLAGSHDVEDRDIGRVRAELVRPQRSVPGERRASRPTVTTYARSS